jgi:hypothetical protein
LQDSLDFLEFLNCFCEGKAVDYVHKPWTTGVFGSPWTGAMADLGSSPELGLRPLRGSRSPGKGGEVEEAAVRTFVGSSVLGGGVFRCGRGGEKDGEWCGMLWGGGSPFIGDRGGCRAAIMADIGGEMGGGVNGSFKHL